MKASLFYAIAIFACTSLAVFGQQSPGSLQKLEASGDVAGTRATLMKAAQASPNNPAALTAYAEFLDRYGDPGTREAYGKLLTALRTGGDQARTASVARRLAMLDLLAGDSAAANTHL